jgi:hypothetical protein
MVKDAVRGWLGPPPYYSRAVGTTGELAVMATPQAQQIIDAMHSIQWRNEVAPRVLFEMMRYKPGAKVHQLTMPVLVCIAEHEREAPGDLARQIAEQAPRGELKKLSLRPFRALPPGHACTGGQRPKRLSAEAPDGQPVASQGHSFIREPPSNVLQPTAFGARDRGDFTAFSCCAPSAAERWLLGVLECTSVPSVFF